MGPYALRATGAAEGGLQGIDVTDVRGAHEFGGMRGHGYWYANDWISTDLILSLREPIPPQKRCLVPGGAQGKSWSFPPDYERCLEETLLGSFPKCDESDISGTGTVLRSTPIDLAQDFGNSAMLW